MLKAAVIGFGGIAKAHRMGYANLEKQGKVQLVCACDTDPEAFHRSIKINIGGETEELSEHIRFYTDLEEMLKTEEIDFVDICLPSFLHSETAVKLLRRGYHVLSEKPMALRYADCAEMVRAAREGGKELMVGQCVRFYPAFDYVKEAMAENRFGKLLGGLFTRLSPPPIWGWDNWFADPDRSGGCLTDLHVHDVDLIRYLFGEPDAVSTRATTSFSVHDTVHSALFYGDVPVTAIGDWSLTGASFEAAARISFEKASVTYIGNRLTVYPKDGTPSFEVPLSDISGYEAEISYFCDVIEGRVENTKNPPESAARTIRLIEHLRESVAKGGEIVTL
jgi:predicted dehydrogenase